MRMGAGAHGAVHGPGAIQRAGAGASGEALDPGEGNGPARGRVHVHVEGQGQGHGHVSAAGRGLSMARMETAGTRNSWGTRTGGAPVHWAAVQAGGMHSQAKACDASGGGPGGGS